MLMPVRRHPRLALALLALTVTACNRSSREAQEVPAPEEAVVEVPVAVGESEPGVVCDEEHRDAVREELQDMCAWSVNAAVVDAPMSPWDGSPYYARYVDVQIAVDLDQIRMLPGIDGDWMLGEGNPLAKQAPIAISDLAAALPSITSRRTNTDGGETQPHWSLQIASDVPSTVVAEVLRTLSNAKMLDGQIVLQNADEPVAVRDPVLHAKLERARAKLAPEQRIGWAKQELERFASPCLNFKDAFDAAAQVDPEQVCVALAWGLTNAMSDCGCERESEVFTVMHALVFGAEPPKNRAAPVRARISPDATPRRGKTWGSIVAGLGQKEDLLSLWVADEENG